MDTEATAPPAPGHRRLRTILLAALVLFAAGTTIIAIWVFRDLSARQRTGTAGGADLADYGAVVDFRLTERSTIGLGLSDLKGTVWVADFIFTNCAGPCPLMSLRMSYLQDSIVADPFLKDKMVRMVSFSVDPDRDTPSVLAAYATRYEADRDRWWFLTGPIETIKHVSIDGFHLSRPDEPLLHSTMFSLVDQHGHVRGYYHSDDENLIGHIVTDITALIKAGG
jgi:cytochrome oxidase Cu insertion factor (SCO1/SenC/PrrC family)